MPTHNDFDTWSIWNAATTTARPVAWAIPADTIDANDYTIVWDSLEESFDAVKPIAKKRRKEPKEINEAALADIIRNDPMMSGGAW